MRWKSDNACVGSMKKDLTMRVYLIYFTFWHHKWNLKWARPLQYDTVTQNWSTFSITIEREFSHIKGKNFISLCLSKSFPQFVVWECVIEKILQFSFPLLDTFELTEIEMKEVFGRWGMSLMSNADQTKILSVFIYASTITQQSSDIGKNFCIRVAHII